MKARQSHSLTAFSLGPGLTEVMEFGGTPQPWTKPFETQPKMADTTLLQFSKSILPATSLVSHFKGLSEHFFIYLYTRRRMHDGIFGDWK